MSVAMMNIREMSMGVRHRHVLMPMGVRLLAVPLEIVCMLMMFVVAMPVIVVHQHVCMRVLVALANMQPDAEHHQRGGHPKQRPGYIRPQEQRKRHAE